jgi:hypothetical protein
VEEFIACDMYPLVAGVSFDRLTTCVTPVSKLKVPLKKFVAVRKDNDEDDIQFLARVELEVEGIVGSCTKPEHDAFLSHVHNRGQLNHIFELAGVAYGPWPMPGTKEFTEAAKKKGLDAAGKNPIKHPKVAGKKKMETTKAAPS